MQSFTAVLVKNDDGTWSACAEEIAGANSQGDTQDEAMENLADAVKMILDYRREQLAENFSVPFERRSYSLSLA
jgi:predicted RNase H-like HicB family nuclease